MGHVSTHLCDWFFLQTTWSIKQFPYSILRKRVLGPQRASPRGCMNIYSSRFFCEAWFSFEFDSNALGVVTIDNKLMMQTESTDKFQKDVMGSEECKKYGEVVGTSNSITNFDQWVESGINSSISNCKSHRLSFQVSIRCQDAKVIRERL